MLLFFSLSSTYLFSKTKHTLYVCMLFCIAVSDSLGIALNSANCATITCLLPSSVQLHHNLFIFWVKKPSSQANAVSCKKKQPRLSSWHSPDIFLARRKPFIHLRLGRGGQKIFIVWSHKRHNKAERYSIHLPLRYAGRAEQFRFCCCINESSCFPNLHPLPRHQTHRPRHTGGLWGEPRWLDYQTFQLDKLSLV